MVKRGWKKEGVVVAFCPAVVSLLFYSEEGRKEGREEGVRGERDLF